MKRVLFVDDDEEIIAWLRCILLPQQASWQAMFSRGGEPALRMMEALAVDVVVADMRMPGMDGSRFLERVRERFPAAVRIILTGYSEIEYALRAVPVAHQVLHKPCSPAMLVQAIDRACNLSSSLEDSTIRRIVGAVGELPCLPRTAAALVRALDDPDVPVSKVGQIVEQDIAISAKVMQLVNSAFFGRSEVITAIHYAVNFLGVDVLKQLVISAEIFRAFQPRHRIEGFCLDGIQSHSQLVASIAAKLPLSKLDASTAMIAALLHDVGKLVLASRLPQECERIRRMTIGGRMSLPAAEEQVLGASHADIGAYLLALWGLPMGIVSAVRRHHRPGLAEGDELGLGACAAVYFANLLANESEAPAGRRAELPPGALEYLRALGREGEMAAWRTIAEAVKAR